MKLVLKFTYQPCCLDFNVRNVLRVTGNSTVGVRYHDTDSFLGTFGKFQKVTVSFIMSVCLSICMEQLGCNWMNFCEI